MYIHTSKTLPCGRLKTLIQEILKKAPPGRQSHGKFKNVFKEMWYSVTHYLNSIYFNIFRASSTSTGVGMEDEAPFLETARDDAADALFRHSGMPRPEERELRKYPVNVSPAAVVSTTFTSYVPWQ